MVYNRGMKIVPAFLALVLTLSSLPATAGTVCPMMGGGIAMDQVTISAQPRSCCPQGACNCSIQAPDFSPAVLPVFASTGLSFAVAVAPWPGAASANTAPIQESSNKPESPPLPDKPYKLTAQYRI